MCFIRAVLTFEIWTCVALQLTLKKKIDYCTYSGSLDHSIGFIPKIDVQM